MDEIYGLFHETVVKMSECDETLKNSWVDDVGKTYYEMNDNIYEYCKKVNVRFLDSEKMINLVKNNVNLDEINDEVNKLIYLANEVL